MCVCVRACAGVVGVVAAVDVVCSSPIISSLNSARSSSPPSRSRAAQRQPLRCRRLTATAVADATNVSNAAARGGSTTGATAMDRKAPLRTAKYWSGPLSTAKHCSGPLRTAQNQLETTSDPPQGLQTVKQRSAGHTTCAYMR